MRRVAPLVPAWCAGLWLFCTAERLGAPDPSATGVPGGELAGEWVVLGVVVVGTLCYLGAPLLGRSLAVWTPGSHLAGMGAANATQEAFGVGLVRVGTLVVLYLVLASFVAIELRGAP